MSTQPAERVTGVTASVAPAGGGGSPAYRAYLRRERLGRVAVVCTQWLLLAVFLGIWQLAAARRWVNPILTSDPDAVWHTFLQLARQGTIWHHTAVTAIETVIGFLTGMVLGEAIAVAIWWSPFLSRVLDPYLVVANAMPKIALGPIFYIWLGSVLSVYGMAVAISLIVTVIMVHTGFQEIDPNKVKLVRSFGASKLQVLRLVVLPGSVPNLLATVKVNVSLTLVGVIVGEFLSSKAGLGFLIIYGSQVFQMNLVITSVVILSLMAAVFYLLVHAVESRIMRHR